MAFLEEMKQGQYSPSKEEIERVRKEAEARGEDPEAAEEKLRNRFEGATGNLREAQAEEAVGDLEREAEKHLGKIDFDEED